MKTIVLPLFMLALVWWLPTYLMAAMMILSLLFLLRPTPGLPGRGSAREPIEMNIKSFL